MSVQRGNSKNGKYRTVTVYEVIGHGGPVGGSHYTRESARKAKRHLVTAIGLKNTDLSIVQNSVSYVR